MWKTYCWVTLIWMASCHVLSATASHLPHFDLSQTRTRKCTQNMLQIQNAFVLITRYSRSDGMDTHLERSSSVVKHPPGLMLHRQFTFVIGDLIRFAIEVYHSTRFILLYCWLRGLHDIHIILYWCPVKFSCAIDFCYSHHNVMRVFIKDSVAMGLNILLSMCCWTYVIYILYSSVSKEPVVLHSAQIAYWFKMVFTTVLRISNTVYHRSLHDLYVAFIMALALSVMGYNGIMRFDYYNDII